MMHYSTIRIISLVFLLSILSTGSFSQLKVSPDHRYLQTTDGMSFFWLGDTAWELFHRLTREEAKMYLENRAAKGFTVIQAVVLAELDGLNTPNANGDKPLIDNDPEKPNEAYFRHVDHIIKEANKLGLIVALLPSWGDKWYKDRWGTGPEIFTPGNARPFGEWIARRYANDDIVWVAGGDRTPQNETHLSIIRSMAEGIRSVVKDRQLITFHPTGGSSSYDFFAGDNWIDFHMSQTGHKVGNPDYKANIKAYTITPARPHINGEPNYEDHPNDWNPREKGWMDDFDTRQAAYWNMLSGGAGHTYGNHNIWQMFDESRTPVNNARTRWQKALDHPGSFQVGYMKRMLEKRDWQKLVMDQSVLKGENPEGQQYKMAAVSSDKDFLMVYIPYGDKTTVNMEKLKASTIRGWWFNPRDGHVVSLGDFDNSGDREFTPTAVGRGSDWVLILDDASKNYSKPNGF
ncbi:MAG TPA: glycoside hydrolase family 140 protein [Cyclobacteriaceae bacterium]